MTAAGFQEPREAIEIEQEPRLPGRGRLSAATAVGVEGRQQGKPDAAHLRGCHDAAASLRRVGVVRTVGGVVQIVELADCREASFQHLHVGPGCDGLDVVGDHAGEKAVHHLAPGPEAVVLGAEPLHESGHGALEGVAVDVGDAGDGDAGKALAACRGRTVRRNGRDGAALDGDQHIAPPSVADERARHMDLCHGSPALLALMLCRAALRTPSRYV